MQVGQTRHLFWRMEGVHYPISIIWVLKINKMSGWFRNQGQNTHVCSNLSPEIVGWTCGFKCKVKIAETEAVSYPLPFVEIQRFPVGNSFPPSCGVFWRAWKHLTGDGVLFIGPATASSTGSDRWRDATEGVASQNASLCWSGKCFVDGPTWTVHSCWSHCHSIYFDQFSGHS